MKSVTRILITALVLTGIGFIPLPYQVETLRPALNAKDFVQVQGGTNQGKGQIYVMAVGVSDARVFSLFLTLLPNYRLETEYVSVPENYFDKENILPTKRYHLYLFFDRFHNIHNVFHQNRENSLSS